MSQRFFIELHSPTSKIMCWSINVDHIVQVRRVDPDDTCQITLISGQITPAESYTEVQALLRGERVV